MVRFAIPNTRDMHIGDMRIALLSFIVSRQRGEQFIARIEDLDESNAIEGKDGEMQDILKKFAIEPDQLFYQSDSLGRHQQFAVSLSESGNAVASGEDTTQAKSTTYQLDTIKPNEAIVYHDTLKGDMTTTPDKLGSSTILHADGKPTQIFATACDDMMMGISMVIRDEEQIDSTSREIYIKRLLGYGADIEYAYLPTIVNGNSVTIKELLFDGFLPDAIINYLLSVGQNPPTEIFGLPDAMEWFSLEELSKESVEFDIDRLRYLNTQHIEMIDDRLLSTLFGFADAQIGKLAKIFLDEASTINELDSIIKTIFTPKECIGDDIERVSTIIQSSPMLSGFDEFEAYIVSQSGLDSHRVTQLLSRLIVGRDSSPRLADIYSHIDPYITEIARCSSC